MSWDKYSQLGTGTAPTRSIVSNHSAFSRHRRVWQELLMVETGVDKVDHELDAIGATHAKDC